MADARPTLELRRGSELVTCAVAVSDAMWFEGHFPGMPLFPGLGIVAMVDASWRLFWNQPGTPVPCIEAYRRVRFRQRVHPGASLRIRVSELEPHRFRFSVEAGGAAACTGEFRTGPSMEALPPVPSVPWALQEENLGRRFASDGTTVGDVLARARILAQLGAAGPARVCVADEDRVVVAAALMAALAGRIQVVFPSSMTPEAARDAYRSTGFSHWLGPPMPGLQAERIADLEVLPAGAGGEASLGHGRAELGLAEPSWPCVVLHTGGTTGQPRCWTKTVGNLIDEVNVHRHGLQVRPDDHLLATVPPHHIYGLLFSVLLPLCSGATVERASPFFPQEIARRIEETHPSVLVSTPAHLRVLAALPAPTRHRMRLVLSSSAMLSAADATAFSNATGLVPLEVYGSTETGGIAVRRQDDTTPAWAPLPGVECRCEGDRLAVRSPFLSPEAERGDDGFFVSSDLADTADGGRFMLLGRSDGVVKVGGERVALADVEKALSAVRGVRDVVVLAVQAESGRGHDIVAVVACDRPSEEVLLEARTALPAPCWPRRLRCVGAIPSTPAGKRDRADLLALLDAGTRGVRHR